MERILRWLETVSTRRRLAVSISVLVSLAALPFAVLLFTNLRSQIEELLPRNAPSIVALDNLHGRLGENMQFDLLVSGATPADRHRFLDRLAAEAEKLPTPPRFVDWRTEEVTTFFAQRKALFIELDDLREVEKRINARVAYEKHKANPFNLNLEGADDAPPPELDSVFEKYKGKAGDLISYPSGYYDSEDGKSTAIIFYPADTGTSYEAAVAFKDAIVGAAARVQKELGTSLKLEYTGDVEGVIQEQLSLQADLLLSTLLVLIFEALLIWYFYRWIPSIWILMWPLAAASAVTFALGYVFIGSLNASSAFLGSIIVGNGINSGIMLLSRYIEERRNRVPVDLAMRTAVRGTLLATIVASLASAIAYAALMVTAFRGYSHFGFMGGIGMVLCWVANFLLIPGMATWADQRWPLKTYTQPPLVDRVFTFLGNLSARRAVSVAVVGALFSVACAVALAPVAPDPIEENTRKLKSSWANEPGGYDEVADRIDRILKRIQTPAVVLVEKEEQVRDLEKKYRQLLKTGPPDQIFGRVFTLFSLVPDDQEAKLEVFARVHKLLSPTRMAKLDPKTRETAQKWLPPADLKPFAASDLPEYVRRQVREKDGTEGKLVLLFPRHGVDTASGKVLRRYAREVRSVDLPQGAWAAGSYLVFADMVSSIMHDGPIATLVAFVCVVLLSLFLARGAGGSLVVTGSLVVGVLWTCGVAAAAGMRLNFLNFIALPITFGIGVDYATNVYGRFKQGERTRENMLKTLEWSGAAVAMASLTTIIGYSSLLFSRNGALFSFGALSCIAEFACLASALVMLPAMINLRLAPLAPAADSKGAQAAPSAAAGAWPEPAPRMDPPPSEGGAEAGG